MLRLNHIYRILFCYVQDVDFGRVEGQLTLFVSESFHLTNHLIPDTVLVLNFLSLRQDLK